MVFPVILYNSQFYIYSNKNKEFLLIKSLNNYANSISKIKKLLLLNIKYKII
jgi:hypothetical protein